MVSIGILVVMVVAAITSRQRVAATTAAWHQVYFSLMHQFQQLQQFKTLCPFPSCRRYRRVGSWYLGIKKLII